MAVTILGLIGHPGSGKDAVADLLVETGEWAKIAFADPVREAMWHMNPVIVDEGIVGGFDDYRNLLETIGYEAAKREYPEVRRLLTSFATDAVRGVIGPNTWTDLWKAAAQEHMAEGYRIVAPDVRFENEVDTIRWLGLSQAKIARVVKPGVGPEKGHESEALASRFPGDFPIHNNGDLENLKIAIEALNLDG